MSSLRAELTALVDRARGQGSNVIAIAALDQVLTPKHRLIIGPDGSWTVEHIRGCGGADCDVAYKLRTAHLLSSPHARGRTYEVWLDDATALKFLDVTL